MSCAPAIAYSSDRSLPYVINPGILSISSINKLNRSWHVQSANRQTVKSTSFTDLVKLKSVDSLQLNGLLRSLELDQVQSPVHGLSWRLLGMSSSRYVLTIVFFGLTIGRSSVIPIYCHSYSRSKHSCWLNVASTTALSLVDYCLITIANYKVSLTVAVLLLWLYHYCYCNCL